jgi:hypothetical protein
MIGQGDFKYPAQHIFLDGINVDPVMAKVKAIVRHRMKARFGIEIDDSEASTDCISAGNTSG